jgi:transcriptional adapter 2-alpha
MSFPFMSNQIPAAQVILSSTLANLCHRKMLKIDVNKSGRIFDYLVSSGIMRLAYDPSVKGIGPGKEGHVIHANGNGTGHAPYGSVNGIATSGAGAVNGGGGGGRGEVPYPRQGLAEVYPPNGAANGSGGR